MVLYESKLTIIARLGSMTLIFIGNVARCCLCLCLTRAVMFWFFFVIIKWNTFRRIKFFSCINNEKIIRLGMKSQATLFVLILLITLFIKRKKWGKSNKPYSFTSLNASSVRTIKFLKSHSICISCTNYYEDNCGKFFFCILYDTKILGSNDKC